jgi:4-hydroxythreonine-4-phosphate dehydrogenase
MLIGITIGDPNGVGPEIILKAYRDGKLNQPFLVIGDYDIISYCNELLNYNISIDAMNILDLGILTRNELKIGQISKESGYASIMYVKKAVELALDKKIDAIVTLPVNKEAVRLTYPDFSGHTEFIASLCGEKNYTMMLASEKLIVTHVSTHLSLKNAIEYITEDRVYNTIKLTYDTLKRFVGDPKIAVAGLNPHAGENGSFGDEEIKFIRPAVERARQDSIDVEGPISPDVVFLKAYKRQYSGVVCMYHDQGHIPLKLLDFEGGVNITIGLKIIRTSVDHGTAFDIAYKGIASTRSLEEAFKFAVNLVKKAL